MKLLEVIRAIREYEGLSGNEKSILYTLAAYAKPDGTDIFPGLDRISRESGVGESTARRLLKRLEAELHLIHESGRRFHRVCYSLDLNRLVAGSNLYGVDALSSLPAAPTPSPADDLPSTNGVPRAGGAALVPSVGGKGPLASRGDWVLALSKEELLEHYSNSRNLYVYTRMYQGVDRAQAEREWDEERHGN